MAQLEMRLILAKIMWKYDFSLVDDKMDWIAASKTYVFWKKPELWVRLSGREGGQV
jgi:cytochrome P450